jgi:hypothetical protein
VINEVSLRYHGKLKEALENYNIALKINPELSVVRAKYDALLKDLNKKR